MLALCPNGHRVEVPDSALGTEARCPTCNATFIPTGEGGARGDLARAETAPGSPRWRRFIDRWNFELLDQLRPAAQLALLLGLLLAIAARGWDAVADGMVRSAQARVNHAETEWRDQWADRLDVVAQEEAAIRAKSNITSRDRERLDELSNQRQELQDERERDEATQMSKWNELERDAAQTESQNQMAQPWREVLFVLGTLLFALGLLVMGSTSEGSLRWFCLVLLAIVVLSVYFGSIWEQGATAASGRSL